MSSVSNLPDFLEERLQQAVTKHGLTAHYRTIRSLAKLTFLMPVEPADDPDSPGLGKSRLGGTPDLPPGWKWAVEDETQDYDDDEPQLLEFLGQINFSELPQLGQTLPSHGILYVFASQINCAHNPHSLMLHTGPMDTLIRHPDPDESLYADDDHDTHGSLVISDFVPGISLPQDIPGLSDAETERLWELVLQLEKIPGQKEPVSRLLGYPSEYSTGSVLHSNDWQLLIQVESHFQKGHCYMNFWDAGCLQIIAPTAKLKLGDFSESLAFVQSH